MKGFKIEQQAKVIMGELANVQTSFTKFYGDFALVGKHIGNASSKFDEAHKKTEKFNNKINQITGGNLVIRLPRFRKTWDS